MDERERWKWGVIAMLAPGLMMSAFLAWWMYLNIGLLSFLLDVVATCGAIALIGKLWSGVYWGFKGPHPIYERTEKPLRALVDKQGQVQVLPLPTYPASLTSLTYHNAPHITAPQTPAIAAPVIEASRALPQAKSIYELAPAMHGADKVLLGYDEQGPIWLEIEDLLSIAMAGNTDRGKSRALLWLVLQFLRLQVETRILDGKADLRKWIGGRYPVAYTPGEIKATVDEVTTEIAYRLEEDSRNPQASFKPMLVVMDELDLLAGRYAKVIDLVELLTKKSRSVGVHGVYSNQSLPADLLGGVQTRGVIVSRICFYCDNEAARLIGVRKDNGGADLLQRIGPPAPQGLALARTAIFGWRLVAFPFVPDQAIGFLLQGLDPLPPLPMKVDRVPPSLSQVEAPQLAPKPRTPEERERERILEAINDNPDASPSAICALAGISNNKVALVRKLIAEAGTLASKED